MRGGEEVGEEEGEERKGMRKEEEGCVMDDRDFLKKHVGDNK